MQFLLTVLLCIGVVGARFGYLAWHWNAYRGNLVDMLALSDGGYSAPFGLLIGGRVGAIWLWRRPSLRRPLLYSALAGVLIYVFGAGLMNDAQPAANHDRSIRIGLVNEDESATTITSFLHPTQLSLPEVLLDPRQQLLRLARSPGLPATLFIDSSGGVSRAHTGVLSAASLPAGISELER